MPSAAKAAAIHTFSTGQQRVLVASSALAQGVNLPCTTVIVRDTHYPGSGPVPLHQLRQMCGRAGRGDQPGLALVLAQTIDQRGPDGLARELAVAAWPTFPQRPAWERRTDWAGLVDRVAADGPLPRTGR